MAEEVAKIQEVKVEFFEQFWEPSGKVAVRTLASAATEVGLVLLAVHFSSVCFGLSLSILSRGPTPDQPSEDNRMSEARRSPSGHDAGGSSGAQV